MNHLQRQKAGCPRRGAAVMELAMVAPVIIALILGTVEVARALHVKQVLSDTCRSSARLAIQPTSTSASVQAMAQKILTYNNLPAGTVTVSINGKPATDLQSAREGDEIGVTVAIEASSVSYIMPFFLRDDSLLRSTIVMRRQG